jgi:4-amino-4-deoxy-L-arabinose transferase-like glycosyltransferase
MAQRTTYSSELILYSLIALLALVLRFADLGLAPLTEFEAQSAYVTHSLTTYKTSDISDQPAYVLLTSPIFSLFGSNEFLARLVPTLFGLALVAIPYFWRDLLGQKAALVLSFALALDPGMVAVSRLASGHMMAISAGLIALTAWRFARPIAAGVFSAIALLASPIIFFGLIPAVLVWATLQPKERAKSENWRPFLIAIAVSLVFGGTFMLSTPGGLEGLGSTFSSFIGGFTGSGVPLSEIGLALLGYSLPAIVFGLLGAVNAWTRNQSLGKVASLFTLFSLLIVIVYPGRQVVDLLWPILGLWVLAAIEVSAYVALPQADLKVALGEAGLMLLLGIFFGIALTKIAANYGDFVYVALASSGLAIFASILIAFGWSKTGAQHGFMWVMLAFSALFMLSASSRFMRVETTDANDLWSPGPAAGSMRVLAENLHNLSVLDRGQVNDLVVDNRSNNPALLWELRDQLPSKDEASAPLVITSEDAQNAQFASYRGQSIAARVHRAWQGWPPNFFAWLFYRQAPTQTEQIILWARADLFPDGQAFTFPAPETTP